MPTRKGWSGPTTHHALYRLVEADNGGWWLIITNRINVNIGRKQRGHLITEAHKLGLHIGFDCNFAPEGAVAFIAELRHCTKRIKGELDDRLRHLASRIAPGGEDRPDSVLAHLKMAAWAPD